MAKKPHGHVVGTKLRSERVSVRKDCVVLRWEYRSAKAWDSLGAQLYREAMGLLGEHVTVRIDKRSASAIVSEVWPIVVPFAMVLEVGVRLTGPLVRAVKTKDVRL